MDPKTTVVICPDQKDLPFKGHKKNYNKVAKNFTKTRDYEVIEKILNDVDRNRKDVKVVVIDTLYYIIMSQFMDKAKTKGFDKYVDMGLSFWKLMNHIDTLREDLTVICMSHTSTEEFGERGFDVPGGKLVKEKVKPEGLSTIVLETEVEYKDGNPDFKFLTQHAGDGLAKSPEGMFPSRHIPNDLAYVVDCIKAYEMDEPVPPIVETKQ